MKQVERAFVRSVVANVSQLVQSSKSVQEKVALLHFEAAKHKLKLDALERRSRMSARDIDGDERLAFTIQLRAKAIAYLRASAKYLLQQERRPLALRQRPQFFSDPGWEMVKKAPTSHRTKTWPFMEFSS